MDQPSPIPVARYPYLVLLGVACSLITVFPAFRPGGIPIAYLSVALAFTCGTYFGLRLSAARRQVVLGFGAAGLFGILYLLAFGRSPDVPLAVRTAVGFALFFTVVTSIFSFRELAVVVVATVPAYLINAAFGIGQYLGLPIAIFASTVFVPETEDLEHVLAAIRGAEAIRGWGVMAFPHIYAFAMALWTLLIASVLASRLRASAMLRGLLMCSLGIGVVATVLSSQRSAVWVVVAGLLFLWFRTARAHLAWKGFLVAILIVSGSTFVLTGNERSDALGRLGGVEGYAQAERQSTWARAVRMIEDDPLFGTAFKAVPGERGIHNGYLAGWARFGLVWLALFSASLLLAWRMVLRSRATSALKISAALLLLEIMVHGATHTNLITIGDLVAWCYLGFALLLVSLHPAARSISPSQPVGAIVVHRA
jgi:O-antigen ligase